MLVSYVICHKGNGISNQTIWMYLAWLHGAELPCTPHLQLFGLPCVSNPKSVSRNICAASARGCWLPERGRGCFGGRSGCRSICPQRHQRGGLALSRFRWPRVQIAGAATAACAAGLCHWYATLLWELVQQAQGQEALADFLITRAPRKC